MDTKVNSQTHQPLLKRAMRNFVKVFSGKAIGAISALAYLALAAQGLGTHDFGLIVLIHSYMLLFTRIISFKSHNIIIKYGADYINSKNFYDFQKLVKFTFCLDFSSAIFGTMAGILIMQLFGTYFGIPAEALFVASLYCFLSVTNINDTTSGLLRLFDRFDLIAIQSLVEPIIRLVGVGLTFYLDGAWQMYLLVWFIARIGGSLTMFVSAFNQLRRRNLLRIFNWQFVGLSQPHQGIWPFAWSSNLHGTVNSVGIQIVTLAIGGTLGPAGAALYKVAQEIAEVTIKAAAVFNTALYPELAKLVSASGERSRIKTIINRSGKIGCLIGIAFTLLLTLSGETVLQMIFGPEFIEAYPVLILLAIGSTIALLTFPHESALYSVGKPQTALLIKLISSTIQVLALLVLLGQYGISGAGYAAITANSVSTALLLVLTRRVLKYH